MSSRMVSGYSRRKTLAEITREENFKATTQALKEYVADRRQKTFADVARDWIKGMVA